MLCTFSFDVHMFVAGIQKFLTLFLISLDFKDKIVRSFKSSFQAHVAVFRFFPVCFLFVAPAE